MAEWSIAAVLKTVELRGSGGSNPSLSASSGKIARLAFCESFFVKRSSVNKFTSGRLSNKSKSRLCRYSCYFSACKLRSKGKDERSDVNPSLSADLMQSRRLRSSVLFLWCVAVGKPPHTPQKQTAVGDSSASTVERVLLTYAGVEPI